MRMHRIMKEFKPIKQHTDVNNSIVSTIGLSVVAAIGINLLISGFVQNLGAAYANGLIVAGLFLVLFSMLYYIHRELSRLNNDYLYKGFFLYDQKNRDILSVPSYLFSLQMQNTLSSALASNTNIKKIWQENDIGVKRINLKAKRIIEHVETESDKLLDELIEYCVIEDLSAHLHDYFSNFNTNEIRKLDRNGVPELLNRNRFITWFSDDTGAITDLRDVLLEDLSLEENLDRISNEYTKPYSRFELVLPKDAVLKVKNNGVIIDHPLFEMTLSYGHSTRSADIPIDFIEKYLGLNEHDNMIHAYDFSVNMHIQFKKGGFFSSKRTKYAFWIDNFATSLNEALSTQAFNERINWDMISTLLQCESIRAENAK